MKKLLFCAAALILLTAPTAVERAPLTINGRFLGNMVVIQGGMWGISLEDVSRALGSTASLEPAMQMQGNHLVVHNNTWDWIKQPDGTMVKTQAAQKKAAPGQFLKVQKPGEISSNISMVNGKAYIPVADFLRAFGDGSVRGTFSGPLQPGGLNLHVNGGPNGIIAILIGL